MVVEASRESPGQLWTIEHLLGRAHGRPPVNSAVTAGDLGDLFVQN